MIDLGQHAGFIAIAYAGVFLGIAALVAWTIVDSRRTSARLDTLGEKSR